MTKKEDRETPYKERSELTILLYPSSYLKVVCKPVTNYKKSLSELVKQMKLKLEETSGLGLAANQVGSNKRLFILKLNNDEVKEFVNPKFEELDGFFIRDTKESCLSIPNVIANLKCRKNKIGIRAKDSKGKEFYMELEGAEAITAQHEMDHLNGLTIFDRMSKASRRVKKSSYKTWKKRLNRQYKKMSGGKFTILNEV